MTYADRLSPASCRPGEKSALAWLAAVAATLALLTGLFLLMVFNDFFHDYEHQRLGIEIRPVEFSPSQFVDELQAYFVSGDPSLMQHPYLSYRERLHYLEVKQLMRTVLGGFLGASAVTAGLLGWMLFRARRRCEPLRHVSRRVLRNVAGILLVMIAASALLALDFDRSFVKLHGLLFEGNNWILPPHTLTVNLFPVQYFSDFFLVYCGLVITTGIVILGTLAAVRPHLKTNPAAAAPLPSMGPVLSTEAFRGLKQLWLKGARAETKLKRK